jgi:hypothetical protein
VIGQADPITIEGDDLCCPICKEYGGLHHSTVKVFHRMEEDENPGTVVTVGAKNPEGLPDTGPDVVRVERQRNLPGRRGTIQISFFCEGGHEAGVLQIMQHKGYTKIGWLG